MTSNHQVELRQTSSKACETINLKHPVSVAKNILRMHELVVDVAQLGKLFDTIPELTNPPNIKTFLDVLFDKANSILKEINK
jgi:hypothetical protein